MTPAMAAGLADKLMEMTDLVAMVDAYHKRQPMQRTSASAAN
jgi:hypothetical protein